MAYRIHVLSLLFILGVLLHGGDTYGVGKRVYARKPNNNYQAGLVERVDDKSGVQFKDGTYIEHIWEDYSAVIRASYNPQLSGGMHVIAKKCISCIEYTVGYLVAEGFKTDDGYKVTTTDNDDAFFYTWSLLPFPENDSPQDVGARVFARWHNRLYYRGFVTRATDYMLHINYDDGDTIDLKKSDIRGVVLDKIPEYGNIHAGQRVIGYWPGRVRFYPGVVTQVKGCCFNKVYHVKYDDGDELDADYNQIRVLSS